MTERASRPGNHRDGDTPTPLQLAILRAKVDGRTDQSVGRVLKIGERTVRRQLDLLASLLGVGGRGGRTRLATPAHDW